MSSLCDVLLVTATDVETEMLLAEIEQLGGGKPSPAHGQGNAYYDLGRIGETRTFHVQCRIGTVGRGAAQSTTSKAIEELKPAMVIMPGIAFGIEPEKQPIGQVLLSEQLLTYETVRVGEKENVARGDRASCSPYLLQSLRMAARDLGIDCKAGLLLSGEKLVDNHAFRSKLLAMAPGAIGGEMEGAGVYAACEQVLWILAKAVCDYGDGKKAEDKTNRQRKAATNAAKVVLHALQQGAFRRDRGPAVPTMTPADRQVPNSKKPVTSARETPASLVHSEKPIPDFATPKARQLSKELDDLKTWRKSKKKAGEDTRELDQAILHKRREVREHGATAGVKLLDDRFELLEKIGKGGFAEVWKAWDEKTEQVVAVKIMHQSEISNQRGRERFFRGARIMAELQHDALPRILLDKGQDGGFHFFVMNYLAGGDLNRYVLSRGGLTLEETITIIHRVGKVLCQAHEKGLVHRDIKPANILLDEAGVACLADFDLVRAGDTTGGTRTTGMGTFIYAAPEQQVGAKSAKSTVDIYSLAMTAIFCLSGKPLPLLIVEHPERVIENLQLPIVTKRVLEKGIAFDVEDRYQHISEFLEAFKPSFSDELSVPNGPNSPKNNLKNASDWLKEADDFYDRNEFEEALTAYERTLEIDFHFGIAWTGKGYALWALGKLKNALLAFEKALEVDPKDAIAWNGKGNVLDDLDRLAESLDAYDQALEIDLQFSDAWYNRGVVFRKQGRKEEALQSYEKALEINPSDVDFLNGKGNILRDLGEHKEALTAYKKALAVDPEYELAWLGKGNAFMELSRPTEALNAYEKALEINAQDAPAWLGKGNALNELDRKREALIAYENALRIDPEYAPAWNGKGSVLDDLNRLSEALDAFGKALAINPQFSNAWYNKGIVFGKLGRTTDVLAVYKELLDLDPEDIDVMCRVGDALWMLGKHQDALHAFEKILEMDSQNALAWNGKGNVLDDLGRKEEALDAYEQALKIEPQNAVAWHNKGILLKSLGKKEESLSAFLKANIFEVGKKL